MDPAQLAFLAGDEHLVDIGDDLFDYEVHCCAPPHPRCQPYGLRFEGLRANPQMAAAPKPKAAALCGDAAAADLQHRSASLMIHAQDEVASTWHSSRGVSPRVGALNGSLLAWPRLRNPSHDMIP